MCRRGIDLLSAVVALLCITAAPRLTNGAAKRKTVHLIFSNHLDIGFTDMDDAVITLYFQHHYPAAVKLAKELDGRNDRFVYLTHSFIASLYLDCPTGLGFVCPSRAAVAEFEDAVSRGLITWHAMPFNPHYELFDADHLKFALNLTFDLDRRFGVRRKATASLRDVPGMTRGVVPVFADAGVRALSGGVNAFSAPPGVPKVTPFIWRDEASGKQIFAMWHPGGYGGYGPGDCIEAAGFDHILCVAWREDNAGPPTSVDEVAAVYATVRSEYPGALVVASSFDAYVDELEAAAPSLDLPVVTGEIGDTWVHGVGSEVIKVADYRAATRLRSACVADPACDSESYAFWNFSRLLLKVPEHTWGIAFLQYFGGDISNYTNAYLHHQLSRPDQHPNYEPVLRSWLHMNAWVPAALEALPPQHPVRWGFDADLALRAAAEATSGPALLGAGARALPRARPAVFETPHWRVQVDWDTGAISRLQRVHRSAPASAAAAAARAHRPDVRRPWLLPNAATSDAALEHGSEAAPGEAADRDGGVLGVDWAAGGLSALGQIEYHVYNASDYQPVWDHYAHMYPVWDGDFGKANLTATSRLHAVAVPRLVNIFQAPSQSDPNAITLHLEYAFPELLVQQAGAPQRMWAIVEADPVDASLHLTVVWQHKTPTRLPESLWVRFVPGALAGDPASWRMNKLGSLISPAEVILNGSHSIHAVQQEGSVSVTNAAATERLTISSLDTALVASGRPSAFPNPNEGPDMTQGMNFNLVNNIWGTNWPQWIPYWERDINRTYRFVLRVEPITSTPAAATPTVR